MPKSMHFFFKRLAGLIFSSFVLLTAGCVPLGMVWLPDSSGFIYPAGKERQQLFFYDAATQKHRLLVADTGAATIIPAVSPDGKQIAVARVCSGGNRIGT